MMLDKLLRAAMLGAMTLGLAACGGDDNGPVPTNPDPDPDPVAFCPTFAEEVEGATEDAPICKLSGTLVGDIDLTADTLWVLSGGVFVGEDAGADAENPIADAETGTLTIEAGTTVIGESGADLLIISRGSQIFANGTAAAPILFTSANAYDNGGSNQRGEWGGLVISGRAPINGCDAGTAICEAEGEGSSGLYGGNDADDNSGVLNYVIVSNAGFEITAENELNGIAFQGVGRGTEVDYVQVNLNADDGVEFFGGTVDAKHVVLTGIGDDSIDWTGGWQGRMQHVVVKQFEDDGDQGIEADNNGDDNESAPVAKPVLANLTLIGSPNADVGALLREGTGANLYNAIITGFGEQCIDIDQQFTFTNAGPTAADAQINGQLTIANSIVFGCTLGGFADAETAADQGVDDPWLVSDWFNGGMQNSTTAITLDNVFTAAGSAADGNGATPAPNADTFFDTVDYIGAFEPGVTAGAAGDWTSGWVLEGSLD
ncbi:MAG TPA: hypothetical protein VF275_12445 [Gammaproteobacteria bacterium]